jgi:hypothetical protein
MRLRESIAQRSRRGIGVGGEKVFGEHPWLACEKLREGKSIAQRPPRFREDGIRLRPLAAEISLE